MCKRLVLAICFFVIIASDCFSQSNEGVRKYSFAVNYDSSIEALVEMAKYDRFEHFVNSKHFPLHYSTGTAIITAELCIFEKTKKLDEILDRLRLEGYRPANVWELISFSIAYPDEQKKYSIWGFGSLWTEEGGINAPCLWDGSHYGLKNKARTLHLFDVEGYNFESGNVFLIVPAGAT